MSVDLTVPSYVILAIVCYYAVLFALSTRRRAREPAPDRSTCFFVVIVPARNEELVLAVTLANLTALGGGGQHRVLVMDDASKDRTAEIAAEWAARDDRVRVISRDAIEGGRGKSDVLNHAYRAVRAWAAAADPWLAGAPLDEIVLGIVDADGQLEEHCLERVTPYFGDPSVGMTQIGVRIANADRSLLARMQDMEFVAFSWLVQIARDRMGSSGPGGNGQFTRISALASLGEQPWAPAALTEDLDLGLRLVESGWRTRFCHATYVDQQGLQHWRPLLRQRTRWIQGHYQCWRHLPSLLGARRVPLRTRLDLCIYLLLVVTIVLVTTNLVLGLLGSFGVIEVRSSFLVGVFPDGDLYRLVTLALSVLPLCVFVVSYQRHSRVPFRWFEVPAAAALFALYTYIWFYATLRAWARIVLRRKSWVKTPRIAAVRVDP